MLVEKVQKKSREEGETILRMFERPKEYYFYFICITESTPTPTHPHMYAYMYVYTHRLNVSYTTWSYYATLNIQQI